MEKLQLMLGKRRGMVGAKPERLVYDLSNYRPRVWLLEEGVSLERIWGMEGQSLT